jgi:fimbrial chaperone protein
MVTPAPSFRSDQPLKILARVRTLILPIILLALAVLLLVGLPRPAAAQAQGGSILIWPVAPVIEADARAAALWLENPGTAPVTLQVRIYAWAQTDARNAYAPQDDILGTPPIVTIAPGEKQLIRLTRTRDVPAAREAAYRVVVDEIPAARPVADAGAAVSFRMRYSLPLFAYGPGLASPDALAKRALTRKGAKRASSEGGAALPQSGPPEPGPTLDWRTGTDADGRYLEIRNRGTLHARLTDVGFAPAFPTGTSPAGASPAGAAPSGTATVARGLFGYVLPGAAMRWPLAPEIRIPDARSSDSLVAAINGGAPAPIARGPD